MKSQREAQTYFLNTKKKVLKFLNEKSEKINPEDNLKTPRKKMIFNSLDLDRKELLSNLKIVSLNLYYKIRDVNSELKSRKGKPRVKKVYRLEKYYNLAPIKLSDNRKKKLKPNLKRRTPQLKINRKNITNSNSYKKSIGNISNKNNTNENCLNSFKNVSNKNNTNENNENCLSSFKNIFGKKLKKKKIKTKFDNFSMRKMIREAKEILGEYNTPQTSYIKRYNKFWFRKNLNKVIFSFI